MNFIIQYSICSLIILSVVFIYNFRAKNMSIFKNNVFLLLTFFGMVLTALDITRCGISLAGKDFPRNIFVLINVLYYFAEIMIALTFFIYCCAIVDYFKFPQKNTVKKVVSIVLPFIIGVIYLVVSSILDNPLFCVFIITSDSVLTGNGTIGYSLFCFFVIFYVIHGAILILRFRKKMERHDYIHIINPIFIMIISVIFQQKFPYARFITFALAMGTLDLSFYIQRPQDVYELRQGVFNLNGFEMMISHLFSIRRKFYVFAIIMDDTDFYTNALGKKERNNLDNCIISSLKASFHSSSSVYKINDFGQYGLIIKNIKKYNVDDILKKISNQIELRWGFSSMDLDLSFRVCVMESYIDVNKYSEVIDIVDHFAASKKFKGKIVKANTMDLSKLHSLAYLEDAIEKGLKNNRFEVYYQPIYSVKDQCLTGAEALIRLRDDDGNFVSPEDFIPVAEQNGSIFEIGKFVFTSVCKTLSEINLNEYNINKVDINLSVIQCIQEDMAKQLIAIRNNYGIPARYINIEITETASTNTPDILLKNMVEMEQDGIELSLDDYGSGNSNIAYILSLPFKMIKIDKGIVWKAFEDPLANIVLKSSIDMVNALNLKALAEGVETEEQANRLIELGCSYLQGYYYSRPVPAAKYLEMVKK